MPQTHFGEVKPVTNSSLQIKWEKEKLDFEVSKCYGILPMFGDQICVWQFFTRHVLKMSFYLSFFFFFPLIIINFHISVIFWD